MDATLRRGHGPAWLAVGLGTGLLVYFALPYEPMAAALLLALVVGAWWTYRRMSGVPQVLGLFGLALLAGMALGALHTWAAFAPTVPEQMTSEIEGRIIRVEQRTATRARITLADVAVERLDAEATPHNIRITARADPGDLSVGTRIRGLASLQPPPEPVRPGGYNPRLNLYFDRIGATGFAFGRVEALPAQPWGSVFTSAASALAQLRLDLAMRYQDQVAGEAGILVGALLVGRRDGLADETYQDLRQAGLAHVLAISGMHMALVTLTALGAFYALVSLSPKLSADTGVARWAAFGALAIALAYLCLSGASTATQRAFVMISTVLLAVVFMRQALTLRAVGLAALIVLAIRPVALLGPSFQMSFAATTALVAVYGAINRSPRLWRYREALRERPKAVQRALLPFSWIVGIGATSLIAGLATAPFAAYHFGEAVPLGLLGNLLALPIVTLVVMPMGLLVLLLTPFAMEALPLFVMAQGVEAVLAVAHVVAAMDGARLPIAALEARAILALTGAGLLAALLVGRAKLLALVPLSALLVGGPFAPLPVAYVEADASVMAIVRQTEGQMPWLDRSPGRGGSFAVSRWQEAIGGEGAAEHTTQWRCDPLGCVTRIGGGATLAFAFEPAALAEDCRVADIIVTPLAAPEACEAPLVLDRAFLNTHGAVALHGSEGAPSGYRAELSFPNRPRPWQR
ncbi:MAG: ComEC/Rec2 family competence protein [Devosiaceae bacterium]|nr:ComEC/Rec2 family competence protein [Devosiaceae bacterium MH13]